MRLESKKYLYDIAGAAAAAMQFVEDKGFRDYTANAMLRSAVERQLEVVGEAVAQLARTDPGPPCRSAIISESLPSAIFSSTGTPRLTIGSSGTCSKPS